ncbi:hypothetical protein BDQ12DRAFT_389839 [Crucibulum laeve]|uniref:Uncharacterized protein n=1 Tax=Crucibulum laeve TaxID=68775 RepID=A0A5C3MAU3_9AGAR|nr:hypothetical protein BDQ12DRAFT_389839 [Crucibulum laeve]
MDFVHKEQFAFALLDLAATAQPLALSEPTASRSASQTVWQPRVIQPSPIRAIPLTRPTEGFHVHSDAIYCYDSDNDFTSSSSSDDDDDEADDFCSAFRPFNLQPVCSYERGLSPVYPTSTVADDEDLYPTSSGAVKAVSSPPHSFLILLKATETLSSSPRKSIKAPVLQRLCEDPCTSALADKLDELTFREPTPPTSEPIVAYKQLPASFDPEEAGCVSSPNLLTVERSTREEADLLIHFTASFSHSPSHSPGSPVLSTSTDPLSSLKPASIKNSPIDWFTETEEEAPWSEECMFPTSGIRDSALSNPEVDYIHPSKDLLLVQEESVYTEDAAKCSLHVIEEEDDDDDEWEEESEQYGEDLVVELYDSDPELEVDFGFEGDEEEGDESESDSDSDDQPIRTPRHLRVRIDLVDWSFDSESNSSFDDFDENPYTVHTVLPHLVLTPPTESEAENAGQEAVNPSLQSVKYLAVPKNTFKSPKPPHAPPGRPVSSVHGAKDEEDSDSDDDDSDSDDEVLMVVVEDEEREEDQGGAAVAVKHICGFDDDVEGEFGEEYEVELLDDITRADATEVVVDAEATAEEIALAHGEHSFWDVDEEVAEVQESIIAHDALPFCKHSLFLYLVELNLPLIHQGKSLRKLLTSRRAYS